MKELRSRGSFGRIARLCIAVALSVCSIWSIGCKKHQESSTAPLASPATHPATQQVQPVTLIIDGAPVIFPRVELRLSATGGGVVAQLRTPTADSNSGNSLYFDMVLEDIDDPANVDGEVWQFKNDDPERSDTLNGIFLRGRAVVMEPLEVQILFGREENATTVEIDGEFRVYDPPDSTVARKVVTISGRFLVKVR